MRGMMINALTALTDGLMGTSTKSALLKSMSRGKIGDKK
jgi:hypothetical protein